MSAQIETLFVTQIYRGKLAAGAARRLNVELAQAIAVLAADDSAGQDWSEKNGYRGYTSYASLNDLPWRMPVFADLVEALDPHVADFAKALDFDLGGRALKLDSLWVNVLPPGGVHTSHIHPHSVVSGTYYVSTPPGASALKLEDPRLGLMMAAPPRKARAGAHNKSFHYIQPSAGSFALWESWLRHEVPLNGGDEDRLSVSFNYA
jgi:uncharacterized protein (TIGR02466 family)